MKKILSLSLCCASLIGLYSAPSWATAATVDLSKDPKYAIPEKRSFPVSEELKPCNDFHAYVCAKAEADFQLRPDRSSHTFAFSDSRERLLQKKQSFMLDLPNSEHLNPTTEQIRSFYLSCMDEKAKAASERSLVQNMLQQLNPLKTKEAVLQWSSDATLKGDHGLLDFDNSPNQGDPLTLDIYFNVNLMRLPDHKYYENPQLMEDYQKLLTSFFASIRPSEGQSKAEQRAKQQIKLQKDFIKVYPVASVRRDRWSEKHEQTQAEALKKYSHLPLQTLLRLTPASAKVSIPVEEGLKFIDEHLADYSVDTWKDSLLLSNVNGALDDAYPGYFKEKFAFDQKYFGGPTQRAERQERCTLAVGGRFLRELDSAMIEKIFPNFDQNKVESIAAAVRSSIRQGIEKNKWLSTEARKEAWEKITVAKLQLVKPRTEKEWDFTPLRIYTKDDFHGNDRTYRQAQIAKVLKELTEPANQEAWGMGPLTVNAYYSGSENKFVLPIGILQYPFYLNEGDLIENLGAVGAVTGHELGHGIDDKGSKYDRKGRLIQWMNENDLKEFQGRSSRLVKQFQDAGFDGKLTLGENSADLVGLTFAYNAAFPDGRGSAEDKRRFFTSYARLWCTVARPDYLELLKKTDPHSAGYARINEQVKHQPGFAEAFQCKSGDKMYLPENERISIW